MPINRPTKPTETALALLASAVAIAVAIAFGIGGIWKIGSDRNSPETDAAARTTRPLPPIPNPLRQPAEAPSAAPLPLHFSRKSGMLRPARQLWQQTSLAAQIQPLFDVSVLNRPYQPYYFDKPAFAAWDAPNLALPADAMNLSEFVTMEDLRRLAPLSAADVAYPLGLDFSASSTPMHGNEARTTLTPIVGMVQFSPQLSGANTFRPQLNLGAGMLLQTVETFGTENETHNEFLPILRAGIGAEWQPFDHLRIHFRYEFSHLTTPSSLNPTLPEREHSLQTGIEIKF